MTGASRDFQWMRTVSDLLYSDMSDDRAREVLYNEPDRTTTLESLRVALRNGTPPQAIPLGDLGDNLFQALLAIRTKFPPEEGRQKVELNIEMRERSR
jgi:hypothetical protein